MATKEASRPLIHFETRSDKPRVFRMTPPLIAEGLARSRVAVATSLGEDLRDLSPLRGAVALVTSNDVMRHPAFPLRDLARAAPSLRWIHIIGAGIEPLLPLDWLPPDVVLTNNSGVHVEKIRESAAMMLLMLNGRLPAMATNQRRARWQQIFTSTIKGKVVLIVGVGDMGGAVAQAARELGLRVIGVRRSGAPHALVERMHTIAELDAALPIADFIVVATPLTRETTRLIDARRLALMKRGAGWMNIGRAGCIDYAALTAALSSGALSGAIVDVFDPEPLSAESPLWHADNLTIIPHVSSDDEVSYLPRTFDLVFENARRLLAGEKLLNQVDRQSEY